MEVWNMGIRKQFTNEFKAKVAMAALKGDKTMGELASEFGVHSTQVSSWRNELKDRAAEVFNGSAGTSAREYKEQIEELYKDIGRIQVENNWLKKKLHV